MRCLVLLALTLLLWACGGGGDDRHSPLVGGSQGALCGASPSAFSSAVYVADQGTDSPGCGTTTANACRTLQQGIDNCTASGCAVFVRHGLYSTQATLRLREGVDVYGSCRFDGEPERRYRSVVDAQPAPGTPAIAADGLHRPTVVDDLVVMTRDVASGGAANIAVAVRGSSGFTMTRSVIVAGRGGDGQAGGAPASAPGGQPGSGGTIDGGFSPGGGGPGGPSCDARGQGAGAGGAGSAWQQNVVSSCGGFACDCNSSGGRNGSAGGPSGAVDGGPGGGPGTQGQACWEGVIRQGLGGRGDTGGPGSAGACSAQRGAASADVWGRFDATGWLPGSGGTGGQGSVGSGGGGGGAGGMCALRKTVFTWAPAWGLPGGGGGAGGCAGIGGDGGPQGGASVALMLVDSSLALDAGSVAVIAGNGGQGAQGAPGGIGGQGGAGAAGASSVYNCNFYDTNANAGWGGPGGPGGPGGQGGAGSGGAGGNGGPAIGIALVGSSPVPDVAGVYAGFSGPGGTGGNGGAGGAGQCSGATGQPGVPGGVSVVFDAAHPPQLAPAATGTAPVAGRLPGT